MSKRDTLSNKLSSSSHPARLWHPVDENCCDVVCELSPRHCKLAPGEHGFCRVRKNQDGRLVTLNYGKSVQVTREVVETEAVWHFAPGERTLSVGNIGCNLHCDFCHNWKTSQAELADDSDIEIYSAEDLVQAALDNGIRILSWTYNDPVVWHEFVLDAARLAHENGIKNVYKSAFYITEKAVDELIEVIDVFSISLKSMDPAFYRKITSGQLEPVLQAIEQVHRSDRHLELSNLVVTGRNDRLEQSASIARWVVDRLGPRVPLHYVGFHPDYLYTDVERTSIAFLVRARDEALRLGLRHVYIGNVVAGEGNNTYCDCGALLVERYGLTTTTHLGTGRRCPNCGASPDIVFLDGGSPQPPEQVRLEDLSGWQTLEHRWHDEISSIHITRGSSKTVHIQALDDQGRPLGDLQSCTLPRFMVSRTCPEEAGVRIYSQGGNPTVLELLDRAHFPVPSGPPDEK